MEPHIERNHSLQWRDDGSCYVQTQVVTTPRTQTGRKQHQKTTYTYEQVEFADSDAAYRFAAAIMRDLSYMVSDVLRHHVVDYQAGHVVLRERGETPA